MIHIGGGPEGVALVTTNDGPDGKRLLIVGNEVDGIVRIFTPQ